ncbi:hypothetical protein Droror1_Dr00024229 [Drosera rotundifolia]
MEDPSGCWHCGEIVSGNGHTYTVRHDAGISSLGGEVIDRVLHKAIQPCPPVINWVMFGFLGTKVGMFSQKEDPLGCWRCGEIMSGNNHTYTVRHDTGIGSLGGQVIDRVPHKAIRPCPLVTKLGSVWVSGDVVEVFHSFAWRVATVVQGLFPTLVVHIPICFIRECGSDAGDGGKSNDHELFVTRFWEAWKAQAWDHQGKGEVSLFRVVSSCGSSGCNEDTGGGVDELRYPRVHWDSCQS